MTKNIRFYALAIIVALALSACSLFSDPDGDNAVQPPPQPTPIPALSMTVTYNTNIAYNTVGQVVDFSYLIGNASGALIPGPVTVIDDRVTPITCPELTLVGNQDNNLDANEALSCTGTYAITQLDLDAGSFSNTATASASGNFSPAVITTITLSQSSLTLSKVADPQTYDNVGQLIIYSYTITNTGTVTLGPAQFVINDDKISAPINCGSDATSLAPNAIVTCSATYAITQADLDAEYVINTASATGGGATSNSITTTIQKAPTAVQPLPPATDLVPGSTISHTVVKNEWLWQIARCYGADPKQVILANSQLYDPAKISPDMLVTVPNIGSERAIYGPPCVPAHTVLTGETWESIAQQYNASSSLLQQVNPGATLTPGSILRVPVNSLGDS